MISSFTTLLAACSMLSCTSIGLAGQPERPDTSGGSPLSRGSGGGGASNDTSPGTGPGSTDHGLHGERWQDRVPREPMWFIQASPGLRDSDHHPEGNSRGIANWWRGENAVDNLLDKVQEGYDIGARWFFINRPMGTPGYTHVPAASWLTIEDHKRDELPAKLADALLDHFDEPVHIVWFIGSDMSDPRNFEGWTTSRSDEFYQIGQDDTWEQLIGSRITLGGWISTGASGLAIDHSAAMGERSHFIRLFEQLNQFPFNLALYGEAFPLTYNTSGTVARDHFDSPVIDQQAIESMPWLGTTEYMESRWPLSLNVESFPVDPDLTRMFIWFDRGSAQYGTENERIDLVNRYMDWNLIPITSDAAMFQEAAARLRTESTSVRAPRDTGSHGTTPTVRVRRANSDGARSPSQQSQRSTQTLPDRHQPRVKGIR